MPRDFLNGASFIKDLYQTGANKKVIPISLTADITFSNEQFKFKPSFNKTSAEPTFPLALYYRVPDFYQDALPTLR